MSVDTQTMESAPAVVCEGLEVSYGDKKAVLGVSFTVERGEVFGLLGPNGAGKTSVVRALTTILDPSAGMATVAGHPLTEPNSVRSAIGVLPESNGYPDAISARDYLVFFGRLYGLSRSEAEDRAHSLLSDVGLAPVSGQAIKTFSRGMRQRLGIARSLVNRPRVLFLDEPTLGLDPAGREEVLNQIDGIATNEGTSVVLCSHILDDVERVCDRVAILKKGRIVSTGTVAAVTSEATASNKVALALDPKDTDRAVAVLEKTDGYAVTSTAIPGIIEVENPDRRQSMNQLLSALIGAEIPILAVQPRNSRLTEAFISLTADRGPDDDV